MALVTVLVIVSCGTPAVSSEGPANFESPKGINNTSSAPKDCAVAFAPAVSADTEGKIGVIFYDKDNSSGAAAYSTLNYAAEAWDAEITWKLGDLDPTTWIAAAENMTAAGCNAILCISFSEAVTQRVSKFCQDNGVYYTNCFSYLTKRTEKK